MKHFRIPRFDVTYLIVTLISLGIIGTFLYVVFASMNW